MLSVYVGSLPGEVYAIDPYFDTRFEPWWITNEYSRQIIRDIDKSEVVAENIIQSPVLGTIPPQWISGSAKTLICMILDDDKERVFNVTGCGDDCAEWVLKIGDMKDITVTQHNCFLYHRSGREKFKIKILNTGHIVTTREEYAEEYWNIIRSW